MDDGVGAATVAAGDAEPDPSAPLYPTSASSSTASTPAPSSSSPARPLLHPLPPPSLLRRVLRRRPLRVSAADVDALLGLLSPGALAPPPSPSPPHRRTSFAALPAMPSLLTPSPSISTLPPPGTPPSAPTTSPTPSPSLPFLQAVDTPSPSSELPRQCLYWVGGGRLLPQLL